jgi:hypothetical protein
MSTIKIHGWIYQNTDGMVGFLFGSIGGTSLLVSVLTVIQSLIMALICGGLGAYGAHLVKKYIIKNDKNENPKD